jgi:Domain of unknown function (DUF4032)
MLSGGQVQMAAPVSGSKQLHAPGLDGEEAPPEIFHKILERRWYLSKRAGLDVGTHGGGALSPRYRPAVPAAAAHHGHRRCRPVRRSAPFAFFVADGPG